MSNKSDDKKKQGVLDTIADGIVNGNLLRDIFGTNPDGTQRALYDIILIQRSVKDKSLTSSDIYAQYKKDTGKKLSKSKKKKIKKILNEGKKKKKKDSWYNI